MYEDEYGNRLVKRCPTCGSLILPLADVGGAIYGGQCTCCLRHIDTEASEHCRERHAMARGLPSNATWAEIRAVTSSIPGKEEANG